MMSLAHVRRHLMVASLLALMPAMWAADPLPVGTGTGLFGYYYTNSPYAVGDVSGSPVATRTDPVLNMSWPSGIPHPALSSLYFTAIWNGLLEPRLTGTYTIIITSNNGRRVWIDGKALINEWYNNLGTYTATIDLVAGKQVPIRVDLYNCLAGSDIRLEWQDPSGRREVIPTRQLYPQPIPAGAVGTGNGLLAGYFPGPGFTGTPVITTDPVVKFSWPSTPFDGFPSDHFSVRWQGRIVPLLNEPTTLILTSKDGARWWIDGVQVADDWTDHATREYRHALPIGAGVAHDIRIDHYESAAPGAVTLEWEGQHTPRRAVPSTQLYPASRILTPIVTHGTGLSARYYRNETLTGPALRRRDQTVDFNWGTGSPDSSIPADHFSARWTGKLQTRFTEPYTLLATGDGGVRVWLDGVQVIGDVVPATAKARPYTFPAKAGQTYALSMEFFEKTGNALARLEWQSASEGRQVVPEACLYPDDLDVAIPAASVTSPAFIEGLHGPSLTIKAGAGKVTTLGESRFFVNQPLSAAQPSTASITAGSMTVTGAITWTPTLLSGTRNLVVRPGDSLLFKAVSSGTWSIGLNCGTVKAPASIASGATVPVTFDNPGIYTINQTNAAGADIAAITVSVPKVITTGTVPVAVDYTRNKDISFANAGDPASVTWTVADPWATVGTGAPPAGAPAASQRLTVYAKTNRASWMVGRINGATGPILATLPVRPLILRSDSEKSIEVERVFSDGSILCRTAIIMEPLVPDLRVKLYAYVSGVTFDDSTTLRWLTSSWFGVNAGRGIYQFKIIRAPGVKTGVCYAWIAFDGENQISQ